MPHLPPPVPPPVPTIAEAARADPAAWFGPDDYPVAAMRRSAEGRTVARLAIGVDGRVTGCTIVSSSGDADLDGATCAIPLRRARFAPARAADGSPVASSQMLPVRWVLPSGGEVERPSREPPATPRRHDWIERLVAAHHLIGGLTAIVAFLASRFRRWLTGGSDPLADGWPDGDRLPVRRRRAWLDGRWARVGVAAGPIVLLAAAMAWLDW